MPDFASLDPLLSKLVEESITAEELAELESLLDGDREAQLRYLSYSMLHANLRDARPHLRGAGGGAAVSAAAGRRSWRPLAALLGAAAALAVVLAFFLKPDPREPTRVASLIDLNGPIAWTEGGVGEIRHLKEEDIGENLPSGRLEAFAAGTWAKFELSDGTTLEVSGHSVLSFSDGEIDLRRGDLSVDAKSPIRLKTPSAEIEVLGTQFNVGAHSTSTRVTVNEGLVRIRRLADGQLLDVPANHFAIVALERESEFRARPRKKFAETWTCSLRRDMLRGDLKGGAIHAHTHLWQGGPDHPEPAILLHTIVLDPSAGGLPPVLVSEGARLRFRGKVEREIPVGFGFTTYRAGGGVSGKYSVMRKIPAGKFEIELPVEDYVRTRDIFPESSIGQEIHYLWIQTVEEDAGLLIRAAELVK